MHHLFQVLVPLAALEDIGSDLPQFLHSLVCCWHQALLTTLIGSQKDTVFVWLRCGAKLSCTPVECCSSCPCSSLMAAKAHRNKWLAGSTCSSRTGQQ